MSATNPALQPRIETQPGLEWTEGLSVVAAPVSFTGTWKTIAGGTKQYTVILKQIGKKVTGSYSPGNGKIFDGVVSDNELAFKWTQDGSYEGNAEFTMDEDGKGFTGTSTALKPTEFTVTWNTYIPPVTSFAGTWETITNGKHSVSLTMVQTGAKVTGVYPRGNGKLEGTVSGRVLRFKWESDGGSGSGRLVMDESEQAFSGTYNKGDNPDDVENTWNGKRPAVTADKAPEKVSLPTPLNKAPGGYGAVTTVPGILAYIKPGQAAGTKTLSWDAGPDHPLAEVWVKVGDGDETFVVVQRKGKREITVEAGKTYKYILMDAGKRLATVNVRSQ